MSRESCSYVPADVTRTLPRTALLPPTSLYQWHAGPRCPGCDLSPNSAVCEFRCRRTWLQRARCNASAANASATRSATADTRPGASLVAAPTSPVGAQPRGNSLSAVAAEETALRTTGAVLSGKKRRQPCKTCATARPKEHRHRAPCRSEISAGPAICRADEPVRGLE
jgi:hypothetical protein